MTLYCYSFGVPCLRYRMPVLYHLGMQNESMLCIFCGCNALIVSHSNCISGFMDPISVGYYLQMSIYVSLCVILSQFPLGIVQASSQGHI